MQIQEKKLDTRLQRTQTALRNLDTEHKQLKDASAAKIHELQGRVKELTQQCADLEVRTVGAYEVDAVATGTLPVSTLPKLHH